MNFLNKKMDFILQKMSASELRKIIKKQPKENVIQNNLLLFSDASLRLPRSLSFVTYPENHYGLLGEDKYRYVYLGCSGSLTHKILLYSLKNTSAFNSFYVFEKESFLMNVEKLKKYQIKFTYYDTVTAPYHYLNSSDVNKNCNFNINLLYKLKETIDNQSLPIDFCDYLTFLFEYLSLEYIAIEEDMLTFEIDDKRRYLNNETREIIVESFSQKHNEIDNEIDKGVE